MPELIWKEKEQVINHHLEVPMRVLDHQIISDECLTSRLFSPPS